MGVANDRHSHIERRRDGEKNGVHLQCRLADECLYLINRLSQRILVSKTRLRSTPEFDRHGQCCVRVGIPVATSTDGRQLSEQSSIERKQTVPFVEPTVKLADANSLMDLSVCPASVSNQYEHTFAYRWSRSCSPAYRSSGWKSGLLADQLRIKEFGRKENCQ